MRKIVAGFVTGLVVAAAAYLWWESMRPAAVVGQPTAEIAAAIAVPETRTVYVYRDAKKPAGAAKDTAVLTAIKTETGTATAILSPEGRASIILQTDPAPWFAKSDGWQGSLYAGVQGGSVVYRGTASRDIARLKNAYVGLIISADRYPEETKFFVGVGIRF
jgi:hypothetical protein